MRWYSLGGLSLHRFYTLHFTLPFIILAIVIIHFVLLHEFGSIIDMVLVLVMILFHLYLIMEQRLFFFIYCNYFFFILCCF